MAAPALSIMLIEGERNQVLTDQLLTVGTLRCYTSGESALRDLLSVHPSLIVVDLQVKDIDGLILISELAQRTAAPLLAVNHATTPAQRTIALTLGADDVIDVPADRLTLKARIEMLIRRSERQPGHDPDEVIICGQLTIDLLQARVLVGGRPLLLTRTEFYILRTLAQHVGAFQTRDQIMLTVWGHDASGASDHLVDVHTGRLRRKLRKAGLTNPMLATVRGIGYMLKLQGEN